MSKELRGSFAFRRKEGDLHRSVMYEIKELAREKEHEYLMLKWAGEQDVKDILQDLNKSAGILWPSAMLRASVTMKLKKKRVHRKFKRLVKRGCYKQLVSFVVKSMFLTNGKLHLNPIALLFLNF